MERMLFEAICRPCYTKLVDRKAVQCWPYQLYTCATPGCGRKTCKKCATLCEAKNCGCGLNFCQICQPPTPNTWPPSASNHAFQCDPSFGGCGGCCSTCFHRASGPAHHGGSLCERCGGEESKQNYVKPPKKTKKELRKQDTIECLKAWNNVKDIILSRILKGMDKNATQGETKEETSSAEALHQIQLDFEFDFYEEKQAQRMVRGIGGSIQERAKYNARGCSTNMPCFKDRCGACAAGRSDGITPEMVQYRREERQKSMLSMRDMLSNSEMHCGSTSGTRAGQQ
jgi:hypothetical protein